MARHDELASGARRSLLACQWHLAVLEYQQAAEAALEVGEASAWYANTVWAAVAAGGDYDFEHALSLLLAARSAEPSDASPREQWLARKDTFITTLHTRPGTERLRILLDDLRALRSAQRGTPADMLYVEGLFHGFCGQWAQALRCFEAGWQVFRDPGISKYAFAYRATICCLGLGQWSFTMDWLHAMATTDIEWSEQAVYHAETELKLALATGAGTAELAQRLRCYTDRSRTISGRYPADQLRELTARVSVLLPAEGDPATLHHPARRELRRRWHRTQSVHGCYEARRLLLDYRLACLRHAAGVPPVDDLFYAKPQSVPTRVKPANVTDFAHRLHQARAAAGWAMHQARNVDGLLECDWRQREVQSRIERIEQIQRAVRG